MPKAQHADRELRGGPVNMWIPGPLLADLRQLKSKLKLSWSELLQELRDAHKAKEKR